MCASPTHHPTTTFVHPHTHSPLRLPQQLKIWSHPAYTPWALRALNSFYLEMKKGTTFFIEQEVEIIAAASSARNKCEPCASFHWPHLLEAGLTEADARLVVRGGLPTGKSDRAERAARLVEATGYLMARSGILLPTERKHLRRLRFNDEQLAEIVAISGATSMMDHYHNFLMATPETEGPLGHTKPLEVIEPWMRDTGPFADTLYKGAQFRPTDRIDL